MNPSYLRMLLPMDDACRRFSEWIGLAPLGQPKKLKASKAVAAACKDGAWRSRVAVYIYQSGEWTVFSDLNGRLASYSAAQWRKLAGRSQLVFAGYNDAVPYGQLVVVRGGRVVREFLDDQQNPRENVNRGRLDFERHSPLQTWIDAASFVDEDSIASYPDTGLLWLFGEVS